MFENNPGPVYSRMNLDIPSLKKMCRKREKGEEMDSMHERKIGKNDRDRVLQDLVKKDACVCCCNGSLLLLLLLISLLLLLLLLSNGKISLSVSVRLTLDHLCLNRLVTGGAVPPTDELIH